MEVVATIDYNFADEKSGELEISNWDEQVKISGAGPSQPIYVDRAELLRALAALDVASLLRL